MAGQGFRRSGHRVVPRVVSGRTVYPTASAFAPPRARRSASAFRSFGVGKLGVGSPLSFLFITFSFYVRVIGHAVQVVTPGGRRFDHSDVLVVPIPLLVLLFTVGPVEATLFEDGDTATEFGDELLGGQRVEGG